jgi:hypothetical protein
MRHVLRPEAQCVFPERSAVGSRRWWLTFATRLLLERALLVHIVGVVVLGRSSVNWDGETGEEWVERGMRVLCVCVISPDGAAVAENERTGGRGL